MVDLALQEGSVVSVAGTTRAKVLDRLRLGDAAFRHLTRAAAAGVLVLLSGVIVSLVDGSMPAFKAFGFGFIIGERLEPAPISSARCRRSTAPLVTSVIAMLIALPVGIGDRHSS